MKLHLLCCSLLVLCRTGCATGGISSLFSGPDVRFLVLDDVPRSRAPIMLDQRSYPGRAYGYNHLFSRDDGDSDFSSENEFLEDDTRVRNHAEPWRESRTGGWELENMLARRRPRVLARNNTLWGGGRGRGRGARRHSFSSLLDEFDPVLAPRAPADQSGLIRLGVHRIWYPGGQVPIEVKLKPRDDSRSYVVVIAKTVPDLNNMTKGGAGDARPGGRPEAAGGRGAVAVPRTQSMYTYRVPAPYLPKEPRHLFVTVLMLSPGPGVDLRVYRRYKLIAVIGDCRFLEEEEYDKSPNCKSAMVAGRTEVLCVCKEDVSTTKQRPAPPVAAFTTPTTPRLQLREKFKPRKTLERRLFQLPTLTPISNCTLAQRTYFHRLLQREYPLDNITAAELLAVQIMQAENILNNQTLYWTCNAFAPIDEDRVILEKAKLRSLSIRRLEDILSKHYQACPLVTAGTVLAMQGPAIEVDFRVHEAAVNTLRTSVRVLSSLPTKTRRVMQELPNVIRSVLKGESLILAHRGSVETREQVCNLSSEAMAVMDDTVNLVVQTQQGASGDRAVYMASGISLWYSRVDVAQMRRKSTLYVKPRIMLTYDKAIYAYSKSLSVVVTVYQKNPFHCAMTIGPITTDLVRPYIRDEATGMRIRGTTDRRRTMRVALQPEAVHGDESMAKLTASTMLIVKFKLPKSDGAIVVKIHPEFIKYFFMAFVHTGSEPSTRDLSQSQMYVLHPLASFVVVMPEDYKAREGDEMYVTFVPLVERSVKGLNFKDVKYPFWHRSDMTIWYSVSAMHWYCVNKSPDGGSFGIGEGCVFSNVSRLGEIICECHQNATAIAGTSTKVTFSTHLKPLENVSTEAGGPGEKEEPNFYFLQYLIPILLAALWVNFVVLFYWTMKIAEIDEQTGATAIAPENKAGNKEVYVLIFQTSYVQYAETTAKIQVELHGTEGTSGKFTLRDPRCNPYFLLAGSTNGLLLTTQQTLGNIIVLSIFSDSEGTRPSWHLKKVDVFHEGTPEKFLFVVDKWLRFQDQDHADILPFVEGHGKKMSIMFQLTFPRVFRLCHLLVSVFAWPSGSRYTRLQRLVTILFLGVLTMFMAMVLRGFHPVPGEAEPGFAKEAERGCVIAAIVFIAGLILQILFTFSKQMPPEKVRLASRDTNAEAAKTARVLTTTRYTTYTRNPEIKIAYEMPEYRDESAAVVARDARALSLAEERVEEGILPTPFLYIGLLVALVLSVVLSGFMVPIGLKYTYNANVSWFKSLIVAILLNNIVIDVIKSIGVAGYVASRKKK
ncbi:uncharacterized protein [Dermacentor albipictus]|uniref:uncharacterized protein n=1 Tax=Dermacentor albipictus TaxID=60249 RepID=UPI0031FBC501